MGLQEVKDGKTLREVVEVVSKGSICGRPQIQLAAVDVLRTDC